MKLEVVWLDGCILKLGFDLVIRCKRSVAI